MNFWEVVGNHGAALITSMSTLTAGGLGYWTAQRANAQRADIERRQWLRGELLSAASDALTASADVIAELDRMRRVLRTAAGPGAKRLADKHDSYMQEAIDGANAARKRFGTGLVKLQLLDTSGDGLALRCGELMDAVDDFHDSWDTDDVEKLIRLKREVFAAKKRVGDEVSARLGMPMPRDTLPQRVRRRLRWQSAGPEG